MFRSDAFRRSEHVAPTVDGVDFRSGDLFVTARRSKTDQEARGVTIDIPRQRRGDVSRAHSEEVAHGGKHHGRADSSTRSRVRDRRTGHMRFKARAVVRHPAASGVLLQIPQRIVVVVHRDPMVSCPGGRLDCVT